MSTQVTLRPPKTHLLAEEKVLWGIQYMEQEIQTSLLNFQLASLLALLSHILYSLRMKAQNV